MRNIVSAASTFVKSSRSLSGRPGGSFTAVAILVFALIVSVVGSYFLYRSSKAAFTRHSQFEDARQQVSELLGLQLDEETGLRGYMASGQNVYLEPYETASPQFAPKLQQLQLFNQAQHLATEQALVDELRAAHNDWQQQVANELIPHPNAPDAMARLRLGKSYVDTMRADFQRLLDAYTVDASALTDQSQNLLVRSTITGAALILLFGLLAILADIVRSRTQAALDRERTVADTLQRGFLSGWDSLAYVRVGTGYISASREAAVGGDLFDIYRLDDNRALVLVADVSGKGFTAAVETARVKYSVRTLAEDAGDPAIVLHKFNRAFMRPGSDPESFVTLFVGILDERDMSLSYASAGHPQAFLRKGSDVRLLDVTGPVIGLSPDSTYDGRRITLTSGDVLILATDGLTEARNNERVMISEEGVIRWIREGGDDPKKIAADLIRRVERYSGGRIADDLALLVLSLK
jgi:serine phosphatase RsbU (regulator of sigma subunit)